MVSYYKYLDDREEWHRTETASVIDLEWTGDPTSNLRYYKYLSRCMFRESHENHNNHTNTIYSRQRYCQLK